MKYLLFLFLLLPFKMFAQIDSTGNPVINGYYPELYQKYLIENDTLIRTFLSTKPINLGLVSKYCKNLDFAEYNTLNNITVYNLFNLEGYDTELKRKIFEKSANFLNCNNKLANFQKCLKNNVLFINLSQEIVDNEVSGMPYEEPYQEYFILRDYNLNRKGFTLLFNTELWKHKSGDDQMFKELTLENNLPKRTFAFRHYQKVYYKSTDHYYYLQLGNLPIQPIKEQSDSYVGEAIFIPILDEQMALEIDNNKNICIMFLFNPGNQRYINYSPSMSSQSYNTIELLTTNKVRMILYDKQTNKVYFDKLYDVINPKTKK